MLAYEFLNMIYIHVTQYSMDNNNPQEEMKKPINNGAS